MGEREQWYTNKELFEMVQTLQGDITALSTQMKITNDNIRKYNGLRERVVVCEQRLAEYNGKQKGSQSMWAYLVGGVGMLFGLLSAIGVI